MTRAGLAALLSFWRRNPVQLITLLVGLSLATALWSGVQAINAEARASYKAASEQLGAGIYGRLIPKEGGIALDTYVALRRDGWEVSPILESRWNGVRLIGVDPITAPSGIVPVQQVQDDVTQELLTTGVLIGRASTLDQLPDSELAQMPHPDVAPGVVLTDISVALRLTGAPISALFVSGPVPDQAALSRAGLKLQSPNGSDTAGLTDSFHLNLTAFGFLAFAVGVFIVHSAVGLAFEQRRPMIRTLRALGMPLRRVLALIALELMIFALIAGAIGVALGYLVAAALLPDVAATLDGLYGAQVSGRLQIRPEWWLSGFAIALGGTAVAAGSAFWSLARMPLLATGRPHARNVQAGRGLWWQRRAVIALVVLAVVLARGGFGLIGGFALFGAILLAAALTLPLVLDRVLALGARWARGALSEWIWADSRQQLPGLSMALMALLLAMATNVGVTTMVNSFRLTFVGFLDQRLAAELYVEVGSSEQAEALTAFLEPRVDQILPIQSVDITVNGLPANLFGQVPHRTYHDNWRFLDAAPDVWQRIDAGEGVAMNEQLARRAGLAIGDQVTFQERALPVLGIYGDYGNPVGQVIVTNSVFQPLYPDVVPHRFGLRLDPDKVPNLMQELQEFGLPPDAMVDQAGIKAYSLGVFERTFTVTGALNVLTLVVAGFALLMSLLTLAGMRLPQLAPIWAQGITRAQLGWIELWRAVLFAALTGMLAVPLGLVLAWVLLTIVNPEAFGWRLPVYLFPRSYLALGFATLVAAILAAGWPALRLARTRPADLLRVFANDR